MDHDWECAAECTDGDADDEGVVACKSAKMDWEAEAGWELVDWEPTVSRVVTVDGMSLAILDFK